MNFQLFENAAADKNNRCRKDPEIQSFIRMLEKPVLRVDRITVAVDDIVHRVDLENDLPLLRETEIL